MPLTLTWTADDGTVFHDESDALMHERVHGVANFIAEVSARPDFPFKEELCTACAIALAKALIERFDIASPPDPY